MKKIETKRLTEAYRKFEAGQHAEGLEELRALSKQLDDPWENAALLYHQALFLLEMNRVPEARQSLENFKTALAALSDPPSDQYDDALPINLAIMAGYTEMRILLKEKRESEALQTVEELLRQYPKQLSIRGFREILHEIDIHRGFLLADCGRWHEAKSLLENASPPDGWEGVLSYYLGHCYYEFAEYERAASKLRDALTLGLTRNWEEKARYVLGLAEFHLGNVEGARDQFRRHLEIADPATLHGIKICEWLEVTSRALGEYEEAERYAKQRKAIMGSGSGRIN